jgi:hypothetical protein
MLEVSTEEAHRIWLASERIKRIADRLVGLGPFSIGLDGLLAPVPLAGTLFSLGAGVWLLGLGLRARASVFTLARMAFYVGFRTVASIIPLEGWIVDILFRGHMFAAGALQKDIERRYGKPAAERVALARSRPFAAMEAPPPLGAV